MYVFTFGLFFKNISMYFIKVETENKITQTFFFLKKKLNY